MEGKSIGNVLTVGRQSEGNIRSMLRITLAVGPVLPCLGIPAVHIALFRISHTDTPNFQEVESVRDVVRVL